MSPLSPKAKKVQDFVRQLGFPFQVVELAASTRTAIEAAEAVGCQLGQIAKSLIFKTKKTGRPILVIASGKNRVDEEKLSQLVGEKIEKADADFVLQVTGFAIGGVPPFAHRQKIETFVDKDLLSYREIWAAAGTPHAVFKLKPEDLAKITAGRVVEIK